ncbi:FAD-dependent oxidoreductase [Shewanella sp. C32]|uniref:FAD-dependent oxidoreductase n=1 Tax=Shewanella electrica TaxID=515560 RepID=A0ABT2FHZ1_9GAMM|nr:FAD-dependent oxidoreductase [Shewanella electrica]MCH1925045.1 FAD-dependent oxidoreductase [Shewanella electrica]MCS4554869.1 FAD-dependent oxidoreductase [Shewanella electrica]
MFKTQSYDVAVIGGGMVGLATACGLAKSGLQVVVIDSRAAAPVTGVPRLRVSAINKASQALLENLGAWHNIPAERLAPYSKMDVWEKDGMGAIQFDAANICENSLGTIIENDAIQYALAQSAHDETNLTLLENEHVRTLAFGEREAWITLERGDSLSAALVVAADGANSWVRQQCQIPLTFWDYDHQAIVATIKTQLPHNGCARQAFSADGPLAFLPLFEADLCSIVWSVPPEKAEQLLALDDESFNKALTAAFDGKLGLCQLQSERQSFPLRMRFARHFAQHRLVLAGDAAHTIHPLAGQGVNLGFLDAGAIVEVVSKLHSEDKDIGAYENLRTLERWRKAEAMEMIAAMEGFHRLFLGNNPVKKAIRDIGLNLVNSVSGMKTLFMQQAMGHKFKLPSLCRPN